MPNSDSLKDAQRKMEEDWLGNGCRLGWLIDPKNQQVYIYRPQQAVELINTFNSTLSGENVLEGFALDLKGFLGE